MKTLKVIVAIVVTVALFFISKHITESDQPLREYRMRSGDYELTHVTTGFHSGLDTSPVFSVRVSGPLSGKSLKATLIYFVPDPTGLGIPSDTSRALMMLAEDSRNEYDASIQPLEAGEAIWYCVQVEDSSSSVLGTIPDDARSSSEYLEFRFKGIAPVWLVILVAGFLAAAMFSATLALISSVTLTCHLAFIDSLGKEALWTTIFLLLGGGVFSAMLSHEVTATAWGGWPFGVANLADTATEAAVICWLILTILLKGSAFSALSKHNLISSSRARIITLVCYPLIVIAYLASRKLPL